MKKYLFLLITPLVLFSLVQCKTTGGVKLPGKVIAVESETFEEEVIAFSETTPVLVDFWAEWCGPCRMQAPIIEEANDELGDKMKFTKLDVDAHGDIANAYNIEGIPTLIIFYKGKEHKRIVGLTGKEELVNVLSSLLEE